MAPMANRKMVPNENCTLKWGWILILVLKLVTCYNTSKKIIKTKYTFTVKNETYIDVNVFL